MAVRVSHFGTPIHPRRLTRQLAGSMAPLWGKSRRVQACAMWPGRISEPPRTIHADVTPSVCGRKDGNASGRRSQRVSDQARPGETG